MTHYRIKKNKNGEYLLQSKPTLFSKWHTDIASIEKDYALNYMHARKLRDKHIEEKMHINPLLRMFK